MWIAAKHSGDKYSQMGEAVVEAWQKNAIGFVYTTAYIVLETVNFLLRKESHHSALTALRMLTESERIKLIYVDEVMSTQIHDLFQRYDDLSLADCSLIALAQKEGIKDIFSFDSAFDKVRGINRRETV